MKLPIVLLALVLLLLVTAAPGAHAAPDCVGVETQHSCTGMDSECIGHHVYAFFEYCFGVRRDGSLPP